MKNLLTSLALCTALASRPVPGISQPNNFWHILAEVHFKSTTDANGYTVEKPIFSNYLKSFQGKTVQIKGYLIPLEETGNGGRYMLSSLPFNVCYFCGAAGPETVVELDTSENLKFSTKQVVMKGQLQLNASDPDHHIYILKSAKLQP